MIQAEHVKATEILDAIITYCKLNNDDVEISKKKFKNGVIKFIVESKQKDGWVSVIDEFNQESNGYPSFRLVIDDVVNRVYVRTKFKAKIGKKYNWRYDKHEEFVENVEDITNKYEEVNLRPIKNYNKRQYSSIANTEHYFEHQFKLHKLDSDRLMTLFSIFMQLRKRHEG